MNKKTNSTTIINAAKQEFQKRGYHNTSIEDIVRAANVSLEDFNDDMGSKEKCCLKVLKSYHAQVKENLIKYEESFNVRQRLSHYLDDYFDNADEIAQKGDAVFDLYNDLRDMDNALSKAAENIMKLQHSWIDEQFITMLKTESAVDQGDRLMAALHGLLFLARLRHDPAMFKSQVIQLKSWIRSM